MKQTASNCSACSNELHKSACVPAKGCHPELWIIATASDLSEIHVLRNAANEKAQAEDQTSESQPPPKRPADISYVCLPKIEASSVPGFHTQTHTQKVVAL